MYKGLVQSQDHKRKKMTKLSSRQAPVQSVQEGMSHWRAGVEVSAKAYVTIYATADSRHTHLDHTTTALLC